MVPHARIWLKGETFQPLQFMPLGLGFFDPLFGVRWIVLPSQATCVARGLNQTRLHAFGCALPSLCEGAALEDHRLLRPVSALVLLPLALRIGRLSDYCPSCGTRRVNPGASCAPLIHVVLCWVPPDSSGILQ